MPSRTWLLPKMVPRPQTLYRRSFLFTTRGEAEGKMMGKVKPEHYQSAYNKKYRVKHKERIMSLPKCDERCRRLGYCQFYAKPKWCKNPPYKRGKMKGVTVDGRKAGNPWEPWFWNWRLSEYGLQQALKEKTKS